MGGELSEWARADLSDRDHSAPILRNPSSACTNGHVTGWAHQHAVPRGVQPTFRNSAWSEPVDFLHV